ncbi:hypothetical protein CYMTET_27740 [Cymbomonas tetramitiformis]|uniref:Uncharacterized protein n=1 Tax=Cymbomonas tetramitiformis TaxID=36881 RepID=A0AAE0FP65_9CHLO|nr:hypothetical protein CYMTET_27740 [Cymbomonas tetramitiformis]
MIAADDKLMSLVSVCFAHFASFAFTAATPLELRTMHVAHQTCESRQLFVHMQLQPRFEVQLLTLNLHLLHGGPEEAIQALEPAFYCVILIQYWKP